jgi:hypothetical protein
MTRLIPKALIRRRALTNTLKNLAYRYNVPYYEFHLYKELHMDIEADFNIPGDDEVYDLKDY